MSRDDWGLALQDLEEADRKNLELVRILKSIPGETADGEWLPANRRNAYVSALEAAHMSIEKSLTALGRLHLRRHLDNHHDIDAMAAKLRPTPSGPFVDALLATLDTAEDDGSHTNWRFAPYLGRSESYCQMTTPRTPPPTYAPPPTSLSTLLPPPLSHPCAPPPSPPTPPPPSTAAPNPSTTSATTLIPSSENMKINKNICNRLLVAGQAGIVMPWLLR